MSSDSESRHALFAETHELPFPLVSDKGSAIAKAYGVTRFGGVLPSRRVSFVIDRDGVVQRVISAELNIAQHGREALEAIDAIGSTGSS